MEAVRLRKENQIYSADEKWVTNNNHHLVLSFSMLFFDCKCITACKCVIIHSNELGNFMYFPGVPWQCSTTKNGPRERTRSCQTSEKWSIKRSIRRKSSSPLYCIMSSVALKQLHHWTSASSAAPSSLLWCAVLLEKAGHEYKTQVGGEAWWEGEKEEALLLPSPFQLSLHAFASLPIQYVSHTA